MRHPAARTMPLEMSAASQPSLHLHMAEAAGAGDGMTARALTLAAAKSIAGTLGFPSKMPGTSYGLPVAACVAGAELSRVPGSACSTCYAKRDQMSWPNARKAQDRRLVSIADPAWCDAMVALLTQTHAAKFRKIDLGLRPGPKLTRLGTRFRLNEMGHHRWHDSGDLQSVEHLAKICEVARRTPKIKHWLPTTELGMVRRYLASGAVPPPNLTIRVSSVMLDDPVRRAWPQTSSVFSVTPPPSAHICPAPQQGHRCGDCRACWSREVAHVAYARH